MGLVYGGGSVGLMGVISKTVAEGGGHVIGYSRHPLPHSSSRLRVGGLLFLVPW
jgi:predicted Rossmann-fold nucleotide-binding protein